MFSYTLSEAPLALSKFLADCFTKMPLWSLCLQNKIWASSWTCRIRLIDRTFTEAYTSIGIMLSPPPNALKTAKFYFRIFGSKARIWFFFFFLITILSTQTWWRNDSHVLQGYPNCDTPWMIKRINRNVNW